MLKKIKLGKKWNDHKKGSVVEVDELRAQYLLKNGFVEEKPRELYNTKT